jgi:NAD(P)-dependent dehydrogenase (short-subunit alcohol dehydrogenase family)
MGRVDGKVAIITGGARGMGASHSRLLASEGAKVVIGDILDVNLTGTFLGIRAVIEPMIAAGSGSIRRPGHHSARTPS